MDQSGTTFSTIGCFLLCAVATLLHTHWVSCRSGCLPFSADAGAGHKYVRVNGVGGRPIGGLSVVAPGPLWRGEIEPCRVSPGEQSPAYAWDGRVRYLRRVGPLLDNGRAAMSISMRTGSPINTNLAWFYAGLNTLQLLFRTIFGIVSPFILY